MKKTLEVGSNFDDFKSKSDDEIKKEKELERIKKIMSIPIKRGTCNYTDMGREAKDNAIKELRGEL